MDDLVRHAVPEQTLHVRGLGPPEELELPRVAAHDAPGELAPGAS